MSFKWKAIWGTRGLEEGQLKLQAVIKNDLRAKNTLRFSPEGVTSWSSLVRTALKGFDLKGALFIADEGLRGKCKASTTTGGLRFQGELEFTKAGLEKAILKAAAGIGIINSSNTFSFSPEGFSGEMRVEVAGLSPHLT